MQIAKKVEELMLDCLNGSEDGALRVDGIVRNFGFSPVKIDQHREEIRALLNEMPDTFHKGKGDGWSFLNLCNDKLGNQWGEHRDMEALVALGIAAGMASYLLPRDMWSILPGGVPYVGFNTSAIRTEETSEAAAK